MYVDFVASSMPSGISKSRASIAVVRGGEWRSSPSCGAEYHVARILQQMQRSRTVRGSCVAQDEVHADAVQGTPPSGVTSSYAHTHMQQWLNAAQERAVRAEQVATNATNYHSLPRITANDPIDPLTRLLVMRHAGRRLRLPVAGGGAAPAR